MNLLIILTKHFLQRMKIVRRVTYDSIFSTVIFFLHLKGFFFHNFFLVLLDLLQFRIKMVMDRTNPNMRMAITYQIPTPNLGCMFEYLNNLAHFSVNRFEIVCYEISMYKSLWSKLKKKKGKKIFLWVATTVQICQEKKIVRQTKKY